MSGTLRLLALHVNDHPATVLAAICVLFGMIWLCDLINRYLGR